MSRGKDYVVLLDGVTIEEVEHNHPSLEREWEPGAGDIAAARRVLLTPDNALEEGERVFDKDPNRQVLQLDATGELPVKIFIGQIIYARDGDNLGDKLVEFEDAPFDGPGYIGGINSEWFLLSAALKEFQHVETRLWQVNHSTLQMEMIEENPYYTFERPPRTFSPEGFPGVIVAIYQGDVSYGFGGDSSRPAHTVLRVYTPQFPDGVNLARFAFKAGIVVDVDWWEGALLVTGDPSRPVAADKPRLPPRIWKVRLPG
ncbi:hypothetical protein [Microbulbifer rhizosphaerae]|uniref:Uncharacterized protein n=1 Tax=Microbulbifer rhizosphaerae TaxID=1562603 RepID=A0A7W4W948_9GAMM|nr:hypothetical protein [Microbulbifer rhizosphaerae]MBB3059943.1 hypothetical protein [Microbulbifer rhizosphaerae]